MIKLVDIKSVKPSAYNPRKADPERLKLTELSLLKLGFVLPIYADKNGEILSGHQRHYVCKKLGVKQVPVFYVESMELEKRKSLNILFNRATNDFSRDDTCTTVTEKLKQLNSIKIGKKIKDIKPDRPDFYPCMDVKNIKTSKIIQANKGKWNPYCRNLAASLFSKKIFMPIVALPDLSIINGIGRLEIAAEKKFDTVPVVFIPQNKGEFAKAMLNLLSMDFDIHNKYADLLRYNSFRRAFTNRAGLGVGLFIGAFGKIRSKDFEFNSTERINKWKAYYGNKVLDFGAGHLKDTQILSDIGADVTPFEPYKITKGTNVIDKEESLFLSREFLKRVASGYEWDSIFISSVLNSVPFFEDRKHIVRILAACSSSRTRVHIWAMSINHKSHYSIETQPLSNTDTRAIRFRLDYEPHIILGGFSDKPKVQKYHTPAEIRELFEIGFESVKTKIIDDSILAIASGPKINKSDLTAAIEFEFDLPYPDGSKMNLADEALKAFRKRGVL